MFFRTILRLLFVLCILQPTLFLAFSLPITFIANSVRTLVPKIAAKLTEKAVEYTPEALRYASRNIQTVQASAKGVLIAMGGGYVYHKMTTRASCEGPRHNPAAPPHAGPKQNVVPKGTPPPAKKAVKGSFPPGPRKQLSAPSDPTNPKSVIVAGSRQVTKISRPSSLLTENKVPTTPVQSKPIKSIAPKLPEIVVSSEPPVIQARRNEVITAPTPALSQSLSIARPGQITKDIKIDSNTTAVTFQANPSYGVPPSSSLPSDKQSLQQKIEQVPSKFQQKTITAAVHQKVIGEQKNAVDKMAKEREHQKMQAFKAEADRESAELHKKNSQYYAQKAAEDYKVQHNPELRERYYSDQTAIQKNFQQAGNLSTNLETINAQVHLLDNYSIHGTENQQVTYAKTRMLEYACDNNGKFVGVFDSETANNIKYYASPNANPERMNPLQQVWTTVRNTAHDSYYGAAEKFGKKFETHPYNVNLKRACDSLIKKDITQAKKDLGAIQPKHTWDGCSECKIHSKLNKEYQQLYSKHYNKHGLLHDYQRNPVWQAINAELDCKNGPEYERLKISAEERFKRDKGLVDVFSKKIGAQVKQETEKVLYEIIPHYENPNAAIEHLAHLSSDNPDPAKRAAFSEIFGTDCFPKIYDNPHRMLYKDIGMPQSINTAERTEERILFLKYQVLNPTNQHEIEHVRQGMHYLKQACELPSQDSKAQIFKGLAQSNFTALTTENSNQKILSCPNLARTFENPEAQAIQDRILPAARNAFDTLQKIPTTATDNESKVEQFCASRTADLVKRTYDSLEKGNVKDAEFIVRHHMPASTVEYVKQNKEDFPDLFEPPISFDISGIAKPVQEKIARDMAAGAIAAGVVYVKPKSTPQALCAPEAKSSTPEKPYRGQSPIVQAKAQAEIEAQANIITDDRVQKIDSTQSELEADRIYVLDENQQKSQDQSKLPVLQDSNKNQKPEEPKQEDDNKKLSSPDLVKNKEGETNQLSNADKMGIKETEVFRNAQADIIKKAERFAKLGLKPLSNKDLKHILNNHSKIGEIAHLRDKTSIFRDDVDLIELILNGFEKGKTIEDGVKIFDSGKDIGINSEGQPTSLIRIVLNQTKDSIRTAFPC